MFCDWYLELIKPILAGDDEAAKAETRTCVAWVLDQCLKLLHPFMPFITEELWAHMVEHGVQRQGLLRGQRMAAAVRAREPGSRRGDRLGREARLGDPLGAGPR